MQAGIAETATDTTTVDPEYSTDKDGFAAKVGGPRVGIYG